jgi:transcriptional regulator with XRE-family HTH domain
MEKFCERLRMRRKELGLTGPYVAERIGVSRNYIYELEKSRKNPSLETVIKLSDVYRDKSLIDDFMKISTKMSTMSTDLDWTHLVEARKRLDKIMIRDKNAYKEAMEYLRYFFNKYDPHND